MPASARSSTPAAGPRSIASLEDPVEVVVEGVAQSQVAEAAGFDLLTGLRSLVRQDPEVIFIGEIRDADAAGGRVSGGAHRPARHHHVPRHRRRGRAQPAGRHGHPALRHPQRVHSVVATPGAAAVPLRTCRRQRRSGSTRLPSFEPAAAGMPPPSAATHAATPATPAAWPSPKSSTCKRRRSPRPSSPAATPPRCEPPRPPRYDRPASARGALVSEGMTSVDEVLRVSACAAYVPVSNPVIRGRRESSQRTAGGHADAGPPAL